MSKLHTVEVVDEYGKSLGTVSLRSEEIRHFANRGTVPARVMLDAGQISALGIEDDTEVGIVKGGGR
jgi:hypothetical protein